MLSKFFTPLTEIPDIFQSVHGSLIKDFHIIGFSLGAHIAGYVGENIQAVTGQKIGRITGLDPAEPLFESTPAFVRLDPTDAEFVDVIHSDAKSMIVFGKTQPTLIDFSRDTSCDKAPNYTN